MEIRKKISLQFTLIVALIQVVLSLAIYLSFAKSREEDLYARLEAKAKAAGQMLIDIVEIDAVLLEKIESNNPLRLPFEIITIYSEDNRILFSNDDKGEMAISLPQLRQVKYGGRVRTTIGEYEVLGKRYTNPKERIMIFVGAVDLYGFQKLAILRLILVAVFVVGLVIVYFAGRLFAGRAVQPILGVMSQVDRIGFSNLNQRLDEGENRDEIARLASTFNKLLDRLEGSFKMQKSFIANASHELNTPLTVITGQLEVVLLKARSSSEYAESITTVLSEIRNLNLLTRKLLLLAQASSEISGSGFTPVRIDDLIWQIRSELQARDPENFIRIDLSENLDDESRLTVAGNDLLLKTALANIMENGCKYSEDHRVEVYLSGDESVITLRFTDQGIGITEDEIGLIFQPFYRSSRVKSDGGHGIGLSLAERIIHLHRGIIRVSSEPAGGSVFTIELPLAGPHPVSF